MGGHNRLCGRPRHHGHTLDQILYQTGERAPARQRQQPLSIQKGNKTNEGEIGLLQSELEALEVAAGGSILDLELNVVVTYGNPSKGDAVKTDRLIGVQFTEDPRELKQGDKFMEITVPFLFLEKKPLV